jgi:hypothetical protein
MILDVPSLDVLQLRVSKYTKNSLKIPFTTNSNQDYTLRLIPVVSDFLLLLDISR